MFELNEVERQKLRDWQEKHDKKCKFANPMSQGAIGGRLTYMFTPTSLGVITKIKCTCGKEADLTDMSIW